MGRRLKTCTFRESEWRQVDASQVCRTDARKNLAEKASAPPNALCRLPFPASVVTGFFFRVWKRVTEIGGHLAFCNVSAQERMQIEWRRLDTLWKVYRPRAEALEEVEK